MLVVLLEGKVSLLGKGPTRKLRSDITHNNKGLIVVLIRLKVVGFLLIIIIKHLPTDIKNNNNYNSSSRLGQRGLEETNNNSYSRAGKTISKDHDSMKIILIVNNLLQLRVINKHNLLLSKGNQLTTLNQ